jgi:ribosome-associated translation inhibitor RaiA
MAVSQVVKKIVRDLCSEVQNKCNGIQDIDVKIEDINGHAKSGMDKRCHLKVRGKERLAIDVDEVDEDIHSAIDNAFRRLKQMLSVRTAKPVQNMMNPLVWY